MLRNYESKWNGILGHLGISVNVKDLKWERKRLKAVSYRSGTTARKREALKLKRALRNLYDKNRRVGMGCCCGLVTAIEQDTMLLSRLPQAQRYDTKQQVPFIPHC